MEKVTRQEWRALLTLVLSQRLEINAIESALLRDHALTDAELKRIRTQAASTAKAWGSQEDDDLLALIRAHSSPDATMLIPPPQEL